MARKQAKNTYRPNMKAVVDSDPKKGSSTLFTGKRVRDLVMCGECLKLALYLHSIYSQKVRRMG